METKLAKQTKDAEDTQKHLSSVKDRVTELEECEKQLRPWKERESKIMYYLGVFKEVMQ